MEGKEQVNNNELNNTNTGGLSNDTILLPYSINRGFDDLFRCYSNNKNLNFKYKIN
jgi:hypothetical protein